MRRSNVRGAVSSPRARCYPIRPKHPRSIFPSIDMKGVTSRPLMNYGFSFLDAPLLYIQVLSKNSSRILSVKFLKSGILNISVISIVSCFEKGLLLQIYLFLENCYHFVVNIVGLIFIDNQPQSCQ